MKLRTPVRIGLPLALACAAVANAQQLIGYVKTSDAIVVGASDDLDGQAVLTGSVSVTAKDHTAPITLSRGGTVRVCQTSVLHVTESRAVEVAAPLLFSLDRGAIEIQMNGTPNDAIMTPDLRLTVRNSGPLDLRMRVARNGDTCVENRGASSPTLAVSDPFGESMYELPPGQHVLFEHGSVKEVVDRETSPCGCPESKGMTAADALLAAGSTPKTGPKTTTPQAAAPAPAQPTPQAAADHPFPAAISEGLEPAENPAPPVPRLAADAFVYNGATKDPDAIQPQDVVTNAVKQAAAAAPPTPPPAPVTKPEPQIAIAAPTPAPQPAPAPPPPAKAAAAPEPPPQDLVHVVGHFFHKLFGRH
jgi:hypothetical protein